MRKFRFKHGIPLEYDTQGYIYFLSRRYRRLPLAKRRKIDELCSKAGGEYAPALKEFITTDRGATEVCGKYSISQSTLERMVKQYYLEFSETL